MKPEQEYPLFLGHVNNLIERRQKVTATYLTVNAAIIGVITFIFKDAQMNLWGKQLAALLLLFTGIVICDLWRRLVKQYSTLISWWYTQLRELETKFSESTKLLTKEYQELYTPERKKLGLTRYETRLIWIFTAIYGVFGVVILGALIIL